MVTSSADMPEKYGMPWTRDELILAFELYCRIPFRQTKATNHRVKELALLLRRSPAAIARKLGNFGAFDPVLQTRNITGLGHGSRLDRQVWDEFNSNWNDLVVEAHKLRLSMASSAAEDGGLPLSVPTGSSEQIRESKVRVHQSFFRQAVLSSYESTCCITGLRIAECLTASHIIPWRTKECYRTDPTNGLCLSATFDRLFDRGLLAVDSDYKIELSPVLLQSDDEIFRKLIRGYHARPIILPKRFLPSKSHLDWHYRNVYQNNP